MGRSTQIAARPHALFGKESRANEHRPMCQSTAVSASGDYVKLTFGTSRSAGVSTSKKSRLAKPNEPATMFDGNI